MEPVVSGSGAGCRQVTDESKLDLSGEVFTGTRIFVLSGSEAGARGVTDESKPISVDVFAGTGEQLVAGSGAICDTGIESKPDLLGEVFTTISEEATSGNKAG